MKKLNENEMKEISAGATYELSCTNEGCTYKVGAEYWGWFFISRLAAEAVVGYKLRSHMIECTAKKVGF